MTSSIVEEIERSDVSESLLNKLAYKVGLFKESLPVPSSLTKKLKEFRGNIRRTTHFRRLSAIADYEGKTRIIAMADWKTQMVLKPLHDRLMASLKRMSSDYTHKHNNIQKSVNSV